MSSFTSRDTKSLSFSQDSDYDRDSVFNFADTVFPYDRHPVTLAQALTGYIPEREDEPEPEEPPLPLTGWRKVLDEAVLVIAFTIPWIISVIISWLPLLKARLNEAPKEILVSIIASTVELASIIIMPLIGVFCFPQLSQTSPPGSMSTFAKFWVWFLLLDPPVTGIYVWTQSNELSCEGDLDSPQCRIGEDFIRGIGGFRVFGVIGTMFITMAISDSVTKKMQKMQKREVNSLKV